MGTLISVMRINLMRCTTPRLTCAARPSSKHGSVDRCADCGADDSAARRKQIHNESLQQAGLLRVDYVTRKPSFEDRNRTWHPTMARPCLACGGQLAVSHKGKHGRADEQ